MRSPVTNTCALATLFLASCGFGLAQSSQCNCAEPPGGVVTCEKGQIPVCIVKDGKVKGLCKSPPPDDKTVAGLNAWILTIILGKEVTVDALKSNPEYQKILFEARLQTTEAIISFVTFSPSMDYLPPSMIAIELNLPVVDPPGFAASYRRPVLTMERKARPRHRFPEDLESNLDRGERLAEVGKYAQAEAAFRAAEQVALRKESKEGLADVYHAMGLNTYALGRFQEGLTMLSQAHQLAPKDASILESIANAWYVLGRYSEAEEAAREVIRIAPTDSSSYELLAILLRRRRAYAEAETSLKKAVMLNPNNAQAYFLLGWVLYSENKFTDAKEGFLNAIRLNPSNAFFYGNLGTTLFRLGEYAKAEEMLKKAIMLQPDFAFFNSELGRVFYTQLRYAEAQQEFERAIHLDPSHHYFFASLGDALYAQGKIAEAKAQYQRAVILYPGDVSYKEKLERVSSRH
jgi:tetratricopeptide (TPR) repeat protein